MLPECTGNKRLEKIFMQKKINENKSGMVFALPLTGQNNFVYLVSQYIHFITSENNIYEYNKLSISNATKSASETGF